MPGAETGVIEPGKPAQPAKPVAEPVKPDASTPGAIPNTEIRIK